MNTAPVASRPALRTRTTIAAGLLGAVALAATMTGSLSAFTASITNSANTGGVGALTMRETGPGADGSEVTCETSAAQTSMTCADINKYGGDLAMAPGGTSTTTITIANPGAVSATSFTLLPGGCALSDPATTGGDLCSTALVTVTQDGTVVIDGATPAEIANQTTALTPVAAGATSSIVISFAIPSGAPDTVQGQSVSQPLTWTFNA